MEGQLAALKDERMDLYKTQASNAQRLLELSDKVRGLEERVKELEVEYVSLGYLSTDLKS